MPIQVNGALLRAPCPVPSCPAREPNSGSVLPSLSSKAYPSRGGPTLLCNQVDTGTSLFGNRSILRDLPNNSSSIRSVSDLVHVPEIRRFFCPQTHVFGTGTGGPVRALDWHSLTYSHVHMDRVEFARVTCAKSWADEIQRLGMTYRADAPNPCLKSRHDSLNPKAFGANSRRFSSTASCCSQARRASLS